MSKTLIQVVDSLLILFVAFIAFMAGVKPSSATSCLTLLTAALFIRALFAYHRTLR